MIKTSPFIPQLEHRFKDTKINKYKQYEIGGDFMIDEQGSQASALKLDFSNKNIKRLFIFLFIGLFILAGQLFYLQIIRGGYYLGLAEGNRIRIRSIASDRGIIYDRNQNPLVKNTFQFFLQFIPADLPRDQNDKEKIIEEVSQLTQYSLEKIKERLNATPWYSYQPIIFPQNIDYPTALKFKTLEESLPGVNLITQQSREYLYPQSFAHLLGYVGVISPEEFEEKEADNYTIQDLIGKNGLELYYEKELKGKNGKEKIEVNSLGKTERLIKSQAPEAGKNLTLTIDLNLQKRVTEITQEFLDRNNLHRAVVIVMDPNNGEILALNSFPTFDNNKFVQGLSPEDYDNIFNDPNQPLFSRFVNGEYPPGSIIKPIIGLGALAEGIINQNTTFNSVGGLWINQWFFPDWKAGGHGLTNITKALAESVNTFFYYIGGGYQNFNGLGVDRIDHYLSLFGLNKKTGIDLPGENSGFIPTPEWKEKTKQEVWYIGDTYHLAIGQGYLLVTPLQVANYTAAIANGGTLYQPHLIKKNSPQIIQKNIVEEKYLEIIQQGMHETTTYGSARSLAALGISAAGKTGTAQVGGDQQSHAWFTCYAPYQNPEIIVTVLVENAGEGSTFALPIARQILSEYFY